MKSIIAAAVMKFMRRKAKYTMKDDKRYQDILENTKVKDQTSILYKY
jgi:hypothetical protein